MSDRTRLVAITAASNLIGTMPDVQNHRGAHPCRRRRTAVRRRRALHRPRRRRLPRSRRRLLRVLAVQVPWSALWGGRRQARRPRRPPARQIVTRSGPGAGTLRTRHPALRTDGGHDRGRRLPRRHDACHRLPARAAAGRHDRTGAPRGHASPTDRGRPATAPHGDRPLPRCAPDADVARDLCRARSAAISAVLAQHDINAPAGSFYAYEASRRLGLPEDGGIRIGLAPYNTAADVDRLVDVLATTLTSVPEGCAKRTGAQPFRLVTTDH